MEVLCKLPIQLNKVRTYCCYFVVGYALRPLSSSTRFQCHLIDMLVWERFLLTIDPYIYHLILWTPSNCCPPSVLSVQLVVVRIYYWVFSLIQLCLCWVGHYDYCLMVLVGRNVSLCGLLTDRGMLPPVVCSCDEVIGWKSDSFATLVCWLILYLFSSLLVEYLLIPSVFDRLLYPRVAEQYRFISLCSSF